MTSNVLVILVFSELSDTIKIYLALYLHSIYLKIYLTTKRSD